MSLLDQVRSGTFHDTTSGKPGTTSEPRGTIATVAERVRAGESRRNTVGDFLDEFNRADSADQQRMIDAEPALSGDVRVDAFLGALAEHLAVRHGLERPEWCVAPSRFLDCFWFVSPTPGFRAISISQAPAAFKRRGVMLPEHSLTRV